MRIVPRWLHRSKARCGSLGSSCFSIAGATYGISCRVFDWINDPTAWVALVTLVVLEIVLGIDNLIFISILTNKLPPEYRVNARRVGIGAALIMRLLLLATVAWIVQLTNPLFTLFDHPFSWRDIILIAGGLFLVWKATREIHHPSTPTPARRTSSARPSTCSPGRSSRSSARPRVLVDSIITAVGMTNEIGICTLRSSLRCRDVAGGKSAIQLIEQNPTIVMLALAFLLMIGMTIADEWASRPQGLHLRGDGFSALVEG